ncbi:hypothetical protein ERO13_D01G090350v2 [Gossypium hirsutum]|nr:hypothetical protein ERO13_D01G090350v2 [Gossypium hirsutum]
MGLPNASDDLSTEVEVDAFRRLFPLRFYEKHLLKSIRPDARPLGRARETTIGLGAVASANGSALAKIGSTTMLGAIKMEVMTPSLETQDEGCIGLLPLTARFPVSLSLLKTYLLSLVLYHNFFFIFSDLFPHASNLFSNC